MPNPFAEIHQKIHEFMRDGGGDFEKLALELYRAQRSSNPAYDSLCRVRGIGEVSEWQQIPAVPTVAFKEMEMTSLPDTERKRVFFSSGTTLRDRSRHFHSDMSLGFYEESLRIWFEANFHEQIPGRKWLFLTPPGSDAPNSSLAHMFQTIASQLPPNDFEFLGGADEQGAWTLNIPLTVEILLKCARGNRPVAILGTAFQFVHLLDELGRQGVHI